MKRSKQVISLLFALALFGSFAIVAPVAAAEEEAPKWVSKAPMKESRTYFNAEVVNGKIYVIGGDKEGGTYLNKIEIYDPNTDLWTASLSMPTVRAFSSSAVFNGKIYIIGGSSGKGYSKNMDIYDPITDTWESGPSLSTSRGYMSATVAGGKIYVIGGGAPGTFVDKMEVYDPEANVWSMGTPLPESMAYSSLVVWQDKIYAFGGEGKNGPVKKVFAYDIYTTNWEEVTTLPENISQCTAELVGNQIYLLGSATTYGATNKVYIFDPATNEWHNGPDMINARTHHASAVIDQTIYVMGGRVGLGALLNQMEALTVSAPDPTPQNPKLAILLNPGEEVQLSVSDNLSDNAGLTWTSSGAGVATVDANGKVTAIGPGLCEITAKNADGSFNQSIPVRVLPGTADLFRLAVHLTPSQTKRLSMLNDQEGVTWKSLDEAVVTVDANGQITAAGAGLAIVEATKGDTTQQMYVRVKAT